MATYAIGDVQGCYSQLRKLLDKCRFDPQRDRLWFVGDLVNRGPQSLAVLRYIKGLGTRAISVLGNHDLHLLVVAAGYAKVHAGDTLDAILKAKDRDELLAWLRQQKLMHAEGGYAMVHAGLVPQWTIKKALKLAGEVEDALHGEESDELLRHMYGNKPDRWNDNLSGVARLRVIVNVMTRLRLCTLRGTMEFAHKGNPIKAPRGYIPWFEVPERRSRGTPIICGHWAALGLRMKSNVFSIDSGCVWGGPLTALKLSDEQVIQYQPRNAVRIEED